MGNRFTVGFAAFMAIAANACVEGHWTDITTPGRSNNPDNREQFDWNGVLSPGQTLEIKGVVGSIHAVPTAAASAEVVAEKRSDRSDLRSVSIEVVRHANGVTICAVYPAQSGGPRNFCAPGDWGQLSTENDNDVEVEFTVLIPRGVVFMGRTVVGDIRANDMTDDVFASTVTGGVRIGTDAVAEASTVTGSISVDIGAAHWGRDLRFTTITGDIVLEIPVSTNADVDMSTLNGRIVSDFPLTETEIGRRRGTIGQGGPELEMSTITGSLTLKSRV